MQALQQDFQVYLGLVESALIVLGAIFTAIVVTTAALSFFTWLIRDPDLPPPRVDWERRIIVVCVGLLDVLCVFLLGKLRGWW